MKLVGIESFALRQFKSGYRGSYIPGIDPETFLKKINDFILENEPELKDGYSHFCKHLFVPNFTEAKKSIIKISDSNEHLLKTGYISRRKEELPVLSRWFPGNLISEELRRGKYLDIILYSREQCEKEADAMNEQNSKRIVSDLETDPDWYIISIKVQDEDYETPMEPITMIRNTMIEEGGSGVPLDRKKYMESVDFWSKHAIVSYFE
ncbi:hypothetical protein FG386_002548 [Cryptosporidium ryanae]|uniref:uncharacterized protein n=1 Tax=Cryptosporidium ryanae TaxID=515981 RepID=UPI003519FFF3|nr:hypothetical protein FG386_002548 [Cryptosporidium ryanae]